MPQRVPALTAKQGLNSGLLHLCRSPIPSRARRVFPHHVSSRVSPIRVCKMAAKRRKLDAGAIDEVELDSVTSNSDSDSDEEEVYEGPVSIEGLPHGQGTITWPSLGNKFEGHFCKGEKEGKGCYYFADGSMLEGTFTNGCIEGEGTYTFPDGSYLKGTYTSGDLNGQCRQYDCKGRITFDGRYKNGIPSGFVKMFDESSGTLMGVVDTEGGLTGPNIAYVYPDGVTALVGEFSRGRMVNARPATLSNATSHKDNPLLDVVFCSEDVGSCTVGYDESTHSVLSNKPLVPDVYEQARVYVSESQIPGADDGLFAKVDCCVGEVVSFYNGIRLTHEEVDAREWALNGNTISLNAETVLDVPAEYSCVDVYCASLGHKANHSAEPNCEYAAFTHPRFGEIKCIRTLRPVRKGEELTCNYGYNHKFPGTSKDDLPKWYHTT